MDRISQPESTVESGRRLKSERKHVSPSEFKNKALTRKERIRIAMDNFYRRSENLTAFDAIAPPAIAGLGGGVRPMRITKDNRPLLNRLSRMALDKYNGDNNQDPHFEFVQVVKSTLACVSGEKYYITFMAKVKQEASNTPSTIFQAQVRVKMSGLTEVKSCAIKT